MDLQQAITEAVDAVIPATAPMSAPTKPQAVAESQVEEEFDDTLPADDEARDDVVEEDDTEEVEEEAPGPDLPEGYVAVPTVSDKLATDFVLRDEHGEVEVPDLVVEYKANGKVRKDRLDQVVKLAQWGVYNEERDRRAQEIERKATAIESERTELARRLDTYEQQLERLLTDDDYLYSVRDAYAQANSPERRAERAEKQVQEVRVQTEMARIAEQGNRFYEAEIAPALKLITESLPTIAPDELEQRMAYAMQLHAETAPNGQPYLPASRFQAARDYIVNDLAIWAQIQHNRRSETATNPETEKAQRELQKARVEAQKAKRAVGQATKPVGRAGNNTAAVKKSSKPTTLDDALDSAMSEILGNIR